MSASADERTEGAERQALAQLEATVGELLAELERLRGRAREAETRRRDVESLLRRFATGDEDPASLHGRIEALQAENRDLRERVRKGRDGVDRLLARIRFLEEAE